MFGGSTSLVCPFYNFGGMKGCGALTLRGVKAWVSA